jgi:hypothetical protein
MTPIVYRSRREAIAHRGGDVEPESRRIDEYAEKNTLFEGAPEVGEDDRSRHAPATLALAVALLFGSPDVSETHVCSEVCDACGATLKGCRVGHWILQDHRGFGEGDTKVLPNAGMRVNVVSSLNKVT